MAQYRIFLPTFIGTVLIAAPTHFAAKVPPIEATTDEEALEKARAWMKANKEALSKLLLQIKNSTEFILEKRELVGKKRKSLQVVGYIDGESGRYVNP